MLAAVREQSGGGALIATLTRWSLASDLPVVLLLDEVDALVGDALISLLRQIRTGYAQRPRAFPQTVILCGVRDVRDYRFYTAERSGFGESGRGGAGHCQPRPPITAGESSPAVIRRSSGHQAASR